MKNYNFDRRTVLKVGSTLAAVGAVGGGATVGAATDAETAVRERPVVDRLEVGEISEFSSDVEWAVTAPDGDLRRVRVVMVPISGTPIDAPVDVATITVSGGDASGVTTLVDEQESNVGAYRILLDVFAGSETEFVRRSESAAVEFEEHPKPIIDRLVFEANGPQTVTVDWAVSDPDTHLENVELSLTTGDDDGLEVDRIFVDADGAEASGVTTLRDPTETPVDDYVVGVVASTDNRLRTARQVERVSVVDDGDSGEEDDDADAVTPTIDRFETTDNSNRQWSRFDVAWTVSAGDSPLAQVRTELLDSGAVVGSDTTSLHTSGEQSGTHSLESRGSTDGIRLTVTDADGLETVETRSV